MRIARYRSAIGAEGYGLVSGDALQPLRVSSFAQAVQSLESLSLFAASEQIAIDTVTLLPPIGEHAKVFCVGYNYAAHGAEMSREHAEYPTLFTRYADSLVGHMTPIVRPPESAEFDWEGELGVVIGRGGRRISAEAALQHVVGVTAVADNSIRDWQFHSTQSTAGKNWMSSGACGPWLEVIDASDTVQYAFVTRLNGDVVQEGNTGDLLFSIPHLISYVSTFTELRPGDLIATGTPSGIGYRAKPPRFLARGDVLEVDIEGIGTLRNPVADEASPSDKGGR